MRIPAVVIYLSALALGVMVRQSRVWELIRKQPLMSRKDPRARLLIPVSPETVIWLRTQAAGRSLGNVVRRVTEQALDHPVPPAVDPKSWRQLTVQLSKKTRSRLGELARTTARTETDLVASMLHARVTQSANHKISRSSGP